MLFISVYKFVFLSYTLNIIITLYFTRCLSTYERFSIVLKSLSFIITLQFIRAFAKYLNGL